MDWQWIKAFHVIAAGISISLFVVRGYWRVHDARRLRARWVRVVPHVNDTLLLGTGIALAVVTQQYPGVQPWLTAKLIGLLVYIGLGLMAFRFARSRRMQLGAGLAAIAVFAYIIAVAVTRHPLPLVG